MGIELDRYRGAKAVPDEEIKSFILSLQPSMSLFSDQQSKEFLPTYKDWLAGSTLNSLSGFKKFSSLSYVHGTIQAFDLFYSCHKGRRFRCFRGEFVYHRLSWRSNCDNWKYLEDDEVRTGDAVVISAPFSDLGAKHPDMDEVLDHCERLGVPVLLDLAYFSLCRNLSIDLNRECIDTLAFSLSKTFWGADRARIGLRCRRANEDDPVDVFNSMGMYNQIGAAIGLELIRRYPPDHNQLRYRSAQESLCAKLGITPSDCVIFGIGDERFSSLNRGSKWNRVCIAEEVSRHSPS